MGVWVNDRDLELQKNLQPEKFLNCDKNVKEDKVFQKPFHTCTYKGSFGMDIDSIFQKLHDLGEKYLFMIIMHMMMIILSLISLYTMMMYLMDYRI